MALSSRRTLISCRNLFATLRAVSIRTHETSSYLNLKINNPHQYDVTDSFWSSSATVFHQLDARRGFAKGRKQSIKEEETEEEDEEEYEEEDDPDNGDMKDGDFGNDVKAAALLQMEAAMDALSRELAKLRTGRASAGMLDHIMVEHYGVKTPLNRMAVVSVLDPKTLSVTPFDPTALKELEKAIITSPLGLNPRADNQRLIAPIPPLTKEHVQAVCKVVAKSSEDVKQSIRRARQKALDSIKKAAPRKKDKDKATISEDDAKRLEKEIDDLTKKFIKAAEDMCKTKEKEIKGG